MEDKIMMNEILDYSIGTVLKETYEDGVCYYIVGEYFIYCNDYHCPQIRPWKFDDSNCRIATEEEKNQFIEDLKKNHLIWNEETGKVIREYEEITINCKVKVRPGTDINDLITKLNMQMTSPYFIYGMKFENR